MGNFFDWLMNLFGDPDKNKSIDYLDQYNKFTVSKDSFANVVYANNYSSPLYTLIPNDSYLNFALHLVSGHEGLNLHVYKDNDGSDTIGFGQHLGSLTYNQEIYLMHTFLQTTSSLDNYLKTKGITVDAAYALCQMAIKNLDTELHNKFPDWYSTLNQHRQAVLIDMVYNLGFGVPNGKHGLLSLNTFLHYVEQHSWGAAAFALSKTAYSRQLPRREKNNMKILVEG